MKTTTRRRILFWGVTGVVAVGAAIAAVMPKAVPVDIATVTRGPITVTLDHEGRTRVRERFVVSAPVSGRVLRIELRPGDTVVANQTVLATLLPGTSALLDARTRAEAQSRVKAAEAMLEQARAARDQARTQSEFANTERDRTKNLVAQGLATPQAGLAADTEAAARQRALDAAAAAAQAAEHELEAARATLLEPGAAASRDSSGRAALVVRSPINGVVLQRLHESEAPMAQGEPLLEVADLSALEAIADFLSTDAVRIKPGMAVQIDGWGGGAPLKGRVDRVEPGGFLKVSALGVEEQRVWVVVNFDEPRAAWQALGDGYRVEARVVVWSQADVVKAPTSALFRHADQWAVFAVENGVARLRPVQVGQRNGVMAEIVSGLKAGEQVVVYPPDTVTDGVRVSQRGT
jgi:HlyD family secretion protein